MNEGEHVNCIICGAELYYPTPTEDGDDVYDFDGDIICTDYSCLKAYCNEHFRRELS